MIPRTFTLVNKQWKVRIVTTKQIDTHIKRQKVWKDMDLEGSTLKGLCDPGSNRILINKDNHSNEEDMEHTYFHELIHALLFADGLSEHDEEYVDRMGGYLHQYERTKKC